MVRRASQGGPGFVFAGAVLAVAGSAFACNAILDNQEGHLVTGGGTGGGAGSSLGGSSGRASGGTGGASKGGSSGTPATGGQGARAGSSTGGASGEGGDQGGGNAGDDGSGGSARGGTGGQGGSSQGGSGGTGGTGGSGGTAGMSGGGSAGGPPAPENCEDTGTCDPVPVTAVGTGQPILALSVSSGIVYVLVDDGSTNSVYKVPSSGGTLASLSMPSSVANIHVDGSYVYGTESGTSTVYRMNIIGTLFTSWTTTNGYGFNMRSNSTALFVGATLSSNYIQSLKKSDMAKFVLVNSLAISYQEFEVDETHAYFMDADRTVVSRNPVDSMASEAVTTALPGETISELALDDGTLLFASNTRVAKAPGAGGDAVTVDDGAGFALQAAGGVAYYFHAFDGSANCDAEAELYATSLADRSERHVATEPSGCPSLFAQDSNAIYWVASDQISVVKALK